jgi:integrase/recombinase XerD
MKQEILEQYKRYLLQHYRKVHTWKNYHRFTGYFLNWLMDVKGKTYKQLTKSEMDDYKAFCLQNYKTNGNVGRLSAVNNFVDDFLGKPKLRVKIPGSVEVNKQVLNNSEITQYKIAAETPLEKLIVTYQIDGLLRPGEFYKLRISQHDVKNQYLYIDDTKTGNNRIIFTPHMIEAFNEYLPSRVQPKRKEDEDKLIIIDKGSHYGLSPSPDSDFIYRRTKKIGLRTGIQKSIYPYLIKPSAITDGFNQQTNPKILQRQARHKKIETTLRYDHTSDEMAKEHFNKIQSKDIDTLSPEDKAKVWLDKLLSNEIDLKTFKTGIDVILPPRRKDEDIGYI